MNISRLVPATVTDSLRHWCLWAALLQPRRSSSLVTGKTGLRSNLLGNTRLHRFPQGKRSSLIAGESGWGFLMIYIWCVNVIFLLLSCLHSREQPLAALLRGVWLPGGDEAEVEVLGSGALGLPAILPIKEVLEDVDGLALRPKARYLKEEPVREPFPQQNPGKSHLSCPLVSCRCLSQLFTSLILPSKLIFRAIFESYANLQFHISLHSQNYEEEEKVRTSSQKDFWHLYYFLGADLWTEPWESEGL